MVSGDYITLTTESSSTAAEYYQLKLFCSDGTDSPSYGSEDSFSSNAEFNSTYSVISLSAAAQNTVFYPSDSEIASLKANGLIIQGYGVKLTKVTARINALLDETDGTRISSSLIDSSATANTKRVFNFLKGIYGEKMLSGVMDCTWNSDVDMDAKVYSDTGKHTALMGFDFIELTKSDSKTWYNPDQVEEAIDWWNNGGLVTFCWHWLDPSADSALSTSYDPTKTGFRIPYDEDADALDETSDNFAYIKKDLDTVASCLSELQDEGVTVIWRPLHEAKGNCGLYSNTGSAWFWWGAGNSCTENTDEDGNVTYTVSTDEDLCAKSYLALWKYMYTYFTETKELHNLIWLWNGQGEKWYPGDDYVDIAGYDVYDDSNAHGAALSYYNDLVEWSNSSKMTTISECGYIPSTEAIQDSAAKWLYYMVWNDDDDLADDKEDDNDNYWGGTAYNSTQDKTKNSMDTDFVLNRDSSELTELFKEMGVIE